MVAARVRCVMVSRVNIFKKWVLIQIDSHFELKDAVILVVMF